MSRHGNSGYIGKDQRTAKAGVYGLKKHFLERLGGNFLGVITPVSYDDDAQAYFDALEAASGWSEPSDYVAKKTAISNYFTALKADSNFTAIKALYIPIWQAAGPNAINAVNPGTYDLTFSGTVTHNAGDYIYSDGTTGYARAAFQGPVSSNPKFFEIGSASAGCNILNTTTENNKAAYGWYGFFALHPRWNSAVTALYWLNTTYNGLSSDGTTNGLWTSNSITPGGSNTNKGELWRDGVSQGQSTAGAGSGSNTHANAVNIALMGRAHSTSGVLSIIPVQFNFWYFGTEITDMSAFNTDTATLLAAI